MRPGALGFAMMGFALELGPIRAMHVESHGKTTDAHPRAGPDPPLHKPSPSSVFLFAGTSASISASLSLPVGVAMHALNAAAQFQSVREVNRRLHIVPHSSRPRIAAVESPTRVSGERAAAKIALEETK